MTEPQTFDEAVEFLERMRAEPASQKVYLREIAVAHRLILRANPTRACYNANLRQIILTAEMLYDVVDLMIEQRTGA